MPTTTTGVATEFINFTRASNATVTDSNGLIKWAAHNLLLASEQFDAASWLKTNAGSTTPTVTANAAVAPNGTTTAETVALGAIDAAGDTSVLYQTFTAVDATYRGGVYVKAATGGDVGKKVWMFMYDSAYRGVASVTLTTEWQLLSATATLTGGVNREFYIATIGATNGGENQGAVSVHLWGAHLYRSDLGGMQANTSAYPMYNPTTPKNLAKYTESWAVGALGWTIGNVAAVADSTTAPNGLQTADLIYPSSTGTNRQTYQSTSGAVSGTRVVVSAYLKSGGLQWVGMLSPSGNNYGCYFDLVNGVKGTEAAGVTGTITSVGNGWYRCSVSQVLSTTTIYGGISFADADNSTTVTASGTSGVYAWGLQMSDSASLDPYVANHFAAPSAAAYYGPRRDFDPVTLACKGLLVEEQRANLLLRSEEFDNVNWTPNGATISANTIAAPSGVVSADTLVEDTSSGFHRVYQAVSCSINTAYTLSVFVKAAGRTQARILETTLGGAFFDLSSAIVLSTDAGVTASIQSVGNGWYRCRITATTSGAQTTFVAQVQIGLAASSTYIGTGIAALYIWGAQLEAGSFATSYIPTGAATATRNADVASVSTQAFPYSATEGTVVVNASSPCIAAIANMITLDNGTTQERIRLLTDVASVKTIVTESNTTQANLSPGSAIANIPFKFAVAYKVNDFAAVVNGSAAATDAAGNVPVVNIARLGADNSGNYLNGHIRQITYLPRRISNTELQTRTA